MNPSRYAEEPNKMLTGHRTPTGRTENRLRCVKVKQAIEEGVEEEKKMIVQYHGILGAVKPE